MNILVSVGVAVVSIVFACMACVMMLFAVVQTISRIEEHHEKVLDIQAGMRENKRK